MANSVLQIASTFTATPMKPALRSALAELATDSEIGFVQYGQMAEFMLRPAQFATETIGAIVLLRIEDWLRDDLKSLPPDPALENQVRQRITSRSTDFINQVSALVDGVPQVWLLV